MENCGKIRNSNIELLRIVAMFFIVSGHFINQGGDVIYKLSINDFLLALLGSGARIAVNIFLIIGVWYMVDSKFSADRILKMYMQVLMYSVPITVVMLFVNSANVPLKDFARGFLPFWGKGLWFASAYITLMLMKPFLDKILTWNKKQLVLLLVLLLTFISFRCTLPGEISGGYVLESIWFWIVYIFIGYIKSYPPKMEQQGVIAIIFGGGGYLALVLCRYLGLSLGETNSIISIAGKQAGQYVSDFKTLPNFFIAFLISIWVISLKEHHNRIINVFAKPIFAVYIVHQVPAFISFIWGRIFMNDRWIEKHNFWYVFVVFIAIYVVCLFTEYIRRNLIEKRIVKLKLFAGISNAINGIMKKADLC